MLLDIPDTLQIRTHVLTGRVAQLSKKVTWTYVQTLPEAVQIMLR
jgi:hypothetical protein